jgi:Replication protein
MGVTAAPVEATTHEGSYDFHTPDETNRSDSEYRLQKWHMQQAAQEMLPHERVAFCLRRLQATQVDVLYAPKKQSAYYGGLMACGSVWLCPICAAKISEHRRKELEQAIETCLTSGGAVYFVTYTIAHKRFDSLETLLQAFLAARKRMKQGRAAQELRQRFHVLGTVSVREVTWSEINGWHPHCHELLDFFPNKGR